MKMTYRLARLAQVAPVAAMLDAAGLGLIVLALLAGFAVT